MNLDTITEIPSLQTSRLLLRKVNNDDAFDIFEFTSDPELTKYTFWNTHRSFEDIHKFISYLTSSDIVSWAIVLNESKKVIGYCFFHSLDLEQKKAEIAFGISRKFWGKGYATEAAREVINYGFTIGKLKRIEGTCMLDNQASSRVLEKLDMKFEEVLHNARQKDGEFYNLKLYTLSPSDHST